MSGVSLSTTTYLFDRPVMQFSRYASDGVPYLSLTLAKKSGTYQISGEDLEWWRGLHEVIGQGIEQLSAALYPDAGEYDPWAPWVWQPADLLALVDGAGLPAGPGGGE